MVYAYGALNHDGETNCHKCQREAAALAALNVEELKADRDRRLAAEQKKAAEEKAAAAEQAKKTKKIAMIAAPIVVVAIVAAVLISNFVKAQQEEAARLDAYNAAVALAEAGQYEEAIAAFTELGDYKDSAEQIKETSYNQAVALFEAGKYDKAISIFTELGNYKDSTEQIANIQNQQMEEQYQTAFAFIADGYFQKAYDIFIELDSYKDSTDIAQQLLAESNTYQEAVNAYQNGNLEPALAIIENRQQYINFSQEDEINIKFLSRYVGIWEYLSGDATTLTKSGDHDKDYSESYSVETKFRIIDGIPYILVDYGKYYERFKVDFEKQELETDKDSNGNISAELTAQDTLLIKRKYVSYVSGHADIARPTCEYTRAE